MSKIQQVINTVNDNRNTLYNQVESWEQFKEIDINKLKGLDFYIFLRELKKCKCKKKQTNLFILYFIINQKPVIDERLEHYDVFINKLINKLHYIKHNQIMLICSNQTYITNTYPIMPYGLNYNSYDLLKYIIKYTKENDEVSIIIKDSQFDKGELTYHSLFINLHSLSDKFNVSLKDFIVANDSMYQKFSY